MKVVTAFYINIKSQILFEVIVNVIVNAVVTQVCYFQSD